jgi:hypothetical protein
MDHASCVEKQAVERYLLGEMPEAERDSFEAHFFECTLCAEAVRDGAMFADNARAVLRAERPAAVYAAAPDRSFAPTRSRGGSWFRLPLLAPLAAALVLAVVAGYQNSVTIPSLRRASIPRELSTTVLRTVRSEVPEVLLRDGQPLFHLAADLNLPGNHPRYVCRLLTLAGAVVLEVEVQASGGSLSLLLPSDRVPDGRYSLEVAGLDARGARQSPDTEQFEFAVRRSH